MIDKKKYQKNQKSILYANTTPVPLRRKRPPKWWQKRFVSDMLSKFKRFADNMRRKSYVSYLKLKKFVWSGRFSPLAWVLGGAVFSVFVVWGAYAMVSGEDGEKAPSSPTTGNKHQEIVSKSGERQQMVQGEKGVEKTSPEPSRTNEIAIPSARENGKMAGPVKKDPESSKPMNEKTEKAPAQVPGNGEKKETAPIPKQPSPKPPSQKEPSVQPPSQPEPPVTKPNDPPEDNPTPSPKKPGVIIDLTKPVTKLLEGIKRTLDHLK